MPTLFFSFGMFAQSEAATPFVQPQNSRNTSLDEVSANVSLKFTKKSMLLPEVITNQLI